MTERDLKQPTAEEMLALPAYVLKRFDDLAQADDPTEVKEVFEDFIAFAPDLARVAIDLTAQLDAERFANANTAVKVKRVEELAERLEREADVLNDSRSGLAVHAGSVKERTVARIRTALEGETR